MRIYHQHIGCIYKDGGITISHRLWPRQSEVDSFSYALNLEEIGGGAGGHGLSPRGATPRQVQNRSSRYRTESPLEKVTARNSVLTHFWEFSSPIRIYQKYEEPLLGTQVGIKDAGRRRGEALWLVAGTAR